jgi:hypothetical protein
MSKFTIDKNFSSGKNVKLSRVTFTPTVKSNSVSKRVSVNHSFRSNKPVTKK